MRSQTENGHPIIRSSAEQSTHNRASRKDLGLQTLKSDKEGLGSQEKKEQQGILYSGFSSCRAVNAEIPCPDSSSLTPKVTWRAEKENKTPTPEPQCLLLDKMKMQGRTERKEEET